MYKILFTCLALLSFFVVSAQTRMIAESHHQYGLPNSFNGLEDSSKYIYSHGRGGAPNEIVKYDTCVLYQPNQAGTNIIPYNRYVQEFNSSNDVKSYITQKWQNAFNKWVNIYQETYIYDLNRHVLSDSFYIFNSSGTRNPYRAILKIYNNLGQLTDSIISTMQSPLKWDTSICYRYSYNSRGQLLEIYNGAIINTQFQPLNHSSLTYNGLGQCVYLLDEYNSTTGWIPVSKHAYTYSATNDLSAIYDMQYINASQSDTVVRTFNTYDNYHHIIEKRVETYSAFYNDWIKLRTLSEYNNDGHLTNDTPQMWSNNAWVISPKDKIGHYYYEPNFPSVIANTNINEAVLGMYPVPADNTLYLQLNEQVQQPYTVSIRDMQGRLVIQQSYTSNTTGPINTSALPVGMYNVMVLSDKGKVRHGRFTVVR